MGTVSQLSDTGIHHSLLPISDDGRLRQLGYKQELSRKLSAWSSFSVSFSIISVLTGLTTTYGVGLTYGGPFTMVYGWPVVGLMTMTVGVSMAEICSAYPTSGGLYFWSAKLCGHRLGPFASWITGCGNKRGWVWCEHGKPEKIKLRNKKRGSTTDSIPRFGSLVLMSSVSSSYSYSWFISKLIWVFSFEQIPLLT